MMLGAGHWIGPTWTPLSPLTTILVGMAWKSPHDLGILGSLVWRCQVSSMLNTTATAMFSPAAAVARAGTTSMETGSLGWAHAWEALTRTRIPHKIAMALSGVGKWGF